MPTPLWKTIDQDEIGQQRRWLIPGDECLYAREYISKGRFQDSTANQLIINFKKHPSRKGRPEWRHKLAAVQQFAQELSEILENNATIMTIPTSKNRTSEEFDDRFQLLTKHLEALRPDLIVTEPLYKKSDSIAFHAGGERDVAVLLRSLSWRGFEGDSPREIVLIDDLITWGTSFAACKQLIQKNCPDTGVVGLFWAKTVWPQPADYFTVVSDDDY